LTKELMQIGRMLNSMMIKAHLFCGQNDHVIREVMAEYLTDTE
jgi:hypothetical protein